MSALDSGRVREPAAEELAEGRQFGLALSGGGIRSATFNLGVLQGLARQGLLHQIEVLSTVSGGGYIGAWLLGRLHERKRRAQPTEEAMHQIEEELKPENAGDPTSDASRPIRFLRRYSNYLTPETGFFSVDSWAIASIWLRNTFLNVMVLIPLVAALLLLPRLLVRVLPHVLTAILDAWGLSVQWDRWQALVFGPLVVVAAGSVIVTLAVGLLGRYWSDENLEYLGRMAAICNMFVVGWGAIALFAVYGPLATAAIGAKIGILGHTLTLGWIATTLAGVITGKNASSGGTTATPGQADNNVTYWISAVAPYVFTIGLLVAISDAVDHMFGTQTDVLQSILILLAIAIVFSSCVDINKFSMHNLYRNRLVRCYLGAARSNERRPNWVGMDPEDDFPLWELHGYGPYPIINATLNLVHGDELAWQTRKGESFTFSTDRCGFERPPVPAGNYVPAGYCPTREYAGSVTLGTAFAISGAAINPNWGYHSSPATSFLMALFNVRLGQWLGNPLHGKWRKKGPWTVLYWIYELLGLTNDKRDFVNLTDGGHFENLGIYELVRRKCRYIIACDAGEDPSYAFEDLANALQKCRTDFGVNIEIQTRKIRPNPATGWSESHCAVGKIEYGGGTHPGYLLYIKASLTGDEPDDVLKYHNTNPEFPHQSTADQWFDESQFESYRMLGLDIMDTVLTPSVNNVGTKVEAGLIPAPNLSTLFQDLSDAWYPQSEFIRESFTKHATTFDLLMERMRHGTARNLLPDFYPDMKELYELPLSTDSASNFVLCNALIQLMENVYVDLHLDEPAQLIHPHNQGWVTLFKQWAKSERFQGAWKVAAPTFGGRFRDFCLREIGLPPVDHPNGVHDLQGD